MKHLLGLLLALGLFLSPRTSEATWSIVLVDPHTKEVAVASVTCLLSLDLRALTPVVVTGIGAGVAQASGDGDGLRRRFMNEQLRARTSPAQILLGLGGFTDHHLRQYGIVDTLGRALSFTGLFTLDWAGGVVGETPEGYAYAIQGNILAGPCVVSAIEDALNATAGDIPEKLMQGMIVADAMGGDGRCSCTPSNPTGCGCPPDRFEKSGHIGFMISARMGDIDDALCSAGGCADGDYFMNLNVDFSTFADPDPVRQLEEQFARWREERVGRPDAVQSDVSVTRTDFGFEVAIQLRDWQGSPIRGASPLVAVRHESDVPPATHIGEVVDHGAGFFTVALTPRREGSDQLRIAAHDGHRPVILMPATRVNVEPGMFPKALRSPTPAAADCNGNGVPDPSEIAEGLEADANGNLIPDACEPTFVRGDADGVLGFSPFLDALFLLQYGFAKGPVPPCLEAIDADDDARANFVIDALYIIANGFMGGPPLNPPHRSCGIDPEPANSLGCQASVCP